MSPFFALTFCRYSQKKSGFRQLQGSVRPSTDGRCFIQAFGMSERQNRKKNMKTLRNTIIGMGMALALALVMSAQADVKTKGGASDLMKVTPPASAPVEIAMTCPKCKSEFSVRTDRFARGVTKPTVLAENHLCDKCGTTLQTVGRGKQATQLALHTCASCK